MTDVGNFERKLKILCSFQNNLGIELCIRMIAYIRIIVIEKFVISDENFFQ